MYDNNCRNKMTSLADYYYYYYYYYYYLFPQYMYASWKMDRKEFKDRGLLRFVELTFHHNWSFMSSICFLVHLKSLACTKSLKAWDVRVCVYVAGVAMWDGWVRRQLQQTAAGIKRGGGPLPGDGRGVIQINGNIQVQLSTDICIHIFQILSIFCKHAWLPLEVFYRLGFGPTRSFQLLFTPLVSQLR